MEDACLFVICLFVINTGRLLLTQFPFIIKYTIAVNLEPSILLSTRFNTGSRPIKLFSQNSCFLRISLSLFINCVLLII